MPRIYSPMLTSMLQYRIRAVGFRYRQSPRHHAHPRRVPGTSDAPHHFNIISPTLSGASESSVTTQHRVQLYATSWNEPRLVTQSFRSRRVEVKDGGDGGRKEGGGTRLARGVERCGGTATRMGDRVDAGAGDSSSLSLIARSFRGWGGEVGVRHAMVKRSGGGRGKGKRAERDEDTTRPEDGWCRAQTQGKY
jgi:hypothetical protein